MCRSFASSDLLVSRDLVRPLLLNFLLDEKIATSNFIDRHFPRHDDSPEYLFPACLHARSPAERGGDYNSNLVPSTATSSPGTPINLETVNDAVVRLIPGTTWASGTRHGREIPRDARHARHENVGSVSLWPRKRDPSGSRRWATTAGI